MQFLWQYSKYKNQKHRSLKKKKKETLKFVKRSYFVNWDSSEYIMSSCDKLIAECLQAANLGEGIKEAVMIKKTCHV